MKRITMIMLLLFSTVSISEAQKIREWTRQKKTQIEYLILQIVAKKVYLEQVKKGYKIAQEGLNTISSFKRGEFNLHDTFFKSLKTVNPQIKGYVRVAETIELQRKIVKEYIQTIRQITSQEAFNAEEITYVRRVFSRLLDDCEGVLDELLAVTTNEELEMKDDERMARIDRVFLSMQDNFTFCQTFSSETKAMAILRLKEKTDIQTSRVLHGLNDQ
jgi:hypothetical protein